MNYPITEKSVNILRRAVSYLYTLKAYEDLKDPTLTDKHAQETLENLAMEQIAKLDKEEWQKEECLDGRR